MTHATLNARALSALSLCASQGRGARYYLEGVLIEIAPRHVTYAATNGEILAAFRENAEKDDADNELLGSFIVPLATCKALKPKIRNRAQLTKMSGAEMRLQGCSIDAIFTPIEGSFLAWRRVVPTTFDNKTAQFNPHYLALAQETMRVLTESKKDDKGTAPCIIHNGDGPAVAHWSAAPDLLVLVMPMRLEAAHDLPLWFNAEEAAPVAQAAE